MKTGVIILGIIFTIMFIGSLIFEHKIQDLDSE